MSKEGTPELTKSWVVVDSEEKVDNETSGVQEVTEDNQQDSDTDSISVISESGCSYRTDEEEFNVVEKELPEEVQEIHEEKEAEEAPPVDAAPVLESPKPDENKGVEKWLYFATSAACAIILIGFSVAVQQYFEGASDVDNFDGEQQFVFSHVRNEEVDTPKIRHKRKMHLDNFQGKIGKLQKNNEFQVSIAPPVGDDDLKIEENVKSNFKLNKNKGAKCDKENCDGSEKYATDHDQEQIPDEIFDKKIKALKAKEDYLKQKEKFLIEREHDLLKKEIKLNKKNYNKHDKRSPFKKERDYEDQLKNTKFKFNKKKRNISGQWYTNLHEARDSMRQRKRAAFKRNKAHWYFQWMVDRARLRVK